MPSPSLDQYAYDVNAGRYRSLTTGRYVPTADVQFLVEAEIQAGFERLGILADKVASGQASVQQLQDATITHLRYSHLTMYSLGRGGVRQLTPTDFAQLTTTLESEYRYLDGFMADIENGNLSAGQIKARLNLYQGAVWTSYHAGEQVAMQAGGFTHMQRFLRPAEHCGPCVGYAAQGVVLIGAVPLPGEGSPCGRSCRCGVKYFKLGKPTKGRVRLTS